MDNNDLKEPPPTKETLALRYDAYNYYKDLNHAQRPTLAIDVVVAPVAQKIWVVMHRVPNFFLFFFLRRQKKEREGTIIAIPF